MNIKVTPEVVGIAIAVVVGIATLGTLWGAFNTRLDALEGLEETVSNLDKTVTELNSTVTNLNNTSKELQTRIGNLASKEDFTSLEKRIGNLASKEDLKRVEDNLTDLQRMLIQKGVARTSNLPALEDALRGIPSLKVSDSTSRQIFFIVPEDQDKAEQLLARWSRKAPVERQKFAGEYFALFKPETPIWEASRDSQDAHLYRFGEIPSSLQDVFERILSSPSAAVVPFGFGRGFTK